MNFNRTLEDLIFTLKNAKKRNINVNLLIGAGCSVTGGIPLANEMVNQLYNEYLLEMNRLNDNDYAKCMSLLTPVERREFISKFVSKSKVNWAHLGIALLLKHNYINRVLTTNFDNILSKACALVGEFPALYDLTLTKDSNFRSDLMLDNSIIYLHGQHSGFILCNTKEEVENQKKMIKPIFDDLNLNSLWIIIGYSGENDAIFELFEEVKTFENRLFWIGYKNNKPSDKLKNNILSEKKYAFYINGYDADDFFTQLTTRLEIFPPTFIQQPFTYLNNLFKDLLSSNSSVNKFSNTKDMIKSAIAEIENDVTRKAEYYLNTEDYYKFTDLISMLEDEEKEKVLEKLEKDLNKDAEKVKETINIINYKLEKKEINNSIKYLDLVINFLLAINNYIYLSTDIEDINKYFLIGEKHLLECIEKNQTNELLKSTGGELYYNYATKIDNTDYEKYITISKKYYAESLKIRINNKALQGLIKLLKNILKNDEFRELAVNELNELNQYLNKYCIQEGLIDNINYFKGQVLYLYALYSSNTDTISLLKKAVDLIEKDFLKNTTDINIIKNLIQASEELANAYKKNNLSYVHILDKIKNYYNILINITHINFNYIIKLNKILTEKYILCNNQESLANEILENYFIVLTKIKIEIYNEYIDEEFFENFLFNDLIDSNIYKKLSDKFINNMGQLLNNEHDNLNRIIEIINEISFNLIKDYKEYKDDRLYKMKLQFTNKLIDLGLKFNEKQPFLNATKGLWYFKNIYLSEEECEKNASFYYNKAISIFDEEDEYKNAFLQKYYLELFKFYIYRKNKIDEGIIYYEKGIEFGEISNYDYIYAELQEEYNLWSVNSNNIGV